MRIARVLSWTRVNRELIIGLAMALGVGTIGWLAIAAALTPDAADASIREFGTLLAVLFGILAAVWWNQSAKLANRLVDQDMPARQSQKDANTLSGAAATFTALALFSSVFAGSPWRSTTSWLCSIGVLLLLAMSGSDIRQEVPISLKQRLEAREVLGFLALAMVTAVFIWRLMT
jgi:hypothetical protein